MTVTLTTDIHEIDFPGYILISGNVLQTIETHSKQESIKANKRERGRDEATGCHLQGFWWCDKTLA